MIRIVETTCDLTGTPTGRYRIFDGKICLGDVSNKRLADLVKVGLEQVSGIND